MDSNDFDDLQPAVGVWSVRVHDRRFWASGWQELLGMDDEPADLGSWLERVHPDDRREMQRLVESNLVGTAGGEFRCPHRIIGSDGSFRPLLLVGRRMHDAAETDAHLLGIALDFARDREKTRRMQESAETLRRLYVVDEWERTRLSGSIHDGMLQDVIAADMLLQSAKSLSPAERLDRMEAARASLSKAIGRGRRLISELHPLILLEQGLAGAIEFLAAEVESGGGGFRVHVSSRLSTDIRSVIWGSNVYRIAREALANAAKHSRADEAFIDLNAREDRFYLTIRDAGVGFDPSAVPPATAGLRNIRERAAIFGGAAHIDSRPGHGATIRLELPLPE